jgi:hypothetical protein
LLERVAVALHGFDVRFALIGAAALAVHGISRSTLDIDLLVVDQRVLRGDFWDELRSSGIEVELRTGDDDDPLAGVVRCDAEGERTVDVIVGRSAWQRDVVEQAVPARYAGAALSVVRPAGLILLKLYAGGFADVQDVRLLVDSSEERGETVAAVEAVLPDLGRDAAALWRRILTEQRPA